MAFTMGAWFHYGVSYYDGTCTTYKNGCFYEKSSIWGAHTIAYPTTEGIVFGGVNSNIDAEIDEVYVWQVRKPASLFSALYGKDLEFNGVIIAR